jgi:hypothetical protein
MAPIMPVLPAPRSPVSLEVVTRAAKPVGAWAPVCAWPRAITVVDRIEGFLVDAGLSM